MSALSATRESCETTQQQRRSAMPMYADLLESKKEEPLDFVLPYDQAETKAQPEAVNETELLAEELYGDGEKAPADLRRVYLLEDHAPVLQDKLGKVRIPKLSVLVSFSCLHLQKRKRELDTVEEADEQVDEDGAHRIGCNHHSLT